MARRSLPSSPVAGEMRSFKICGVNLSGPPRNRKGKRECTFNQLTFNLKGFLYKNIMGSLVFTCSHGVCHDVEIEPKLQSLEGESFHNKTTTTEDDARLVIKANGLWGGRFSRTFFDVKFFNPHAKSCPKTISDAYKYLERVKTLKYQQRILDVLYSLFH